MNSAVKSLDSINGKLLVSLSEEIQLYKWIQFNNSCGLKLECQIGGVSNWQILASRGNLFVGCGLSLIVSVRRYKVNDHVNIPAQPIRLRTVVSNPFLCLILSAA